MLLKIITEKKKNPNSSEAKSAETFQRNSKGLTTGETNERLKCLTEAEVENFTFLLRQKRQL